HCVARLSCFLIRLAFTCEPASSLFPYTTLFRSRGGQYFTVKKSRYGGKQGPSTHHHQPPPHMQRNCARRRPRLGTRGISGPMTADRKSTRLNSSHVKISYAVFCLKKKTHKAADD